MFPYYAFPTPSDSEYLRALAEERAAREQYAAARLAQEEARARAARAQAARRAYASPYGAYLGDDYLSSPCNDFDIDGDSLDDAPAYGFDPSPRARSLGFEGPRVFGYGSNPYTQRALMEERRRRELLEKERRKLEEARIRKILREEREREDAARQRLLEEEKMRRALEEERLRQALREEEAARERERAQMRAQQSSVDPIDILRVLGFAPPATVSEKERPGRQPTTRTSPSGNHRTTPSPIRPFPFGQTSASQHAQSPARKTPSPQPTTTIPISSSNSTPTPPTPEQLAAAEHILAAYRAHVSRKAALTTISSIRKRFLTARSGFTLPTTLDYDVASHSHAPPTTVALAPNANFAELASNEDEVLEGVPGLAYTSTNAPLHAYEEELNRILGALDAVESNGDLGVRAARRELARAVEREAEKVDRWRGVVWRWWVESQKAAPASAPAPSNAPVVAPVVTEAETPADAPVTQAEDEHIRAESLFSAPAPKKTGETCQPADARQDAIPVEAPMEVDVEAALPSDSSPAPVPTASTNSDDAAAPPVTISIANPTPPEPVEVVEATPALQSGTKTACDSGNPLQPEAPSVDTISTESASDDLHSRPVTPALSQGPSEAEEMEVESLGVHTPPPATYVPLVEVDTEPLPEAMRLERKEPVLGTVEAPRKEVAASSDSDLS